MKLHRSRVLADTSVGEPLASTSQQIWVAKDRADSLDDVRELLADCVGHVEFYFRHEVLFPMASIFRVTLRKLGPEVDS